MKNVKTAKGRRIDMAALARENEEVRAVSNVPMNARGDKLDKSGNVVATVQNTARKQHDTRSAPETRKMSEVPGNQEKQKKKPANRKKEQEPVEVSREVKTRDDGSKYTEIEYDNGNMEIEEHDE